MTTSIVRVISYTELKYALANLALKDLDIGKPFKVETAKVSIEPMSREEFQAVVTLEVE